MSAEISRKLATILGRRGFQHELIEGPLCWMFIAGLRVWGRIDYRLNNLLTLSLRQARAVSKIIFDCFFLVYWVHLNDIYQILGGWFTRCLETSMFYFISYMIQPYWKGAKLGCTDFPLIIIRLEMHYNGSSSSWR